MNLDTLSQRNEPTLIFKSFQDFQAYQQARPDGFVVVCNAKNERLVYKITSLTPTSMSLFGADGSQWNPSFDKVDGMLKMASGVCITFPTAQEIQDAHIKFSHTKLTTASATPVNASAINYNRQNGVDGVACSDVVPASMDTKTRRFRRLVTQLFGG